MLALKGIHVDIPIFILGNYTIFALSLLNSTQYLDRREIGFIPSTNIFELSTLNRF